MKTKRIGRVVGKKGNATLAKFMELVPLGDNSNLFMLPNLHDFPKLCDFFNFVSDQMEGEQYKIYPEFDTDWNWLMHVVERIESLLEGNIEVKIKCNSCSIYITTQFPIGMVDLNIEYYNEPTKINAVFLACVEFAIFYRRNKLLFGDTN